METYLVACLRRTTERMRLLYRLLSRHDNPPPFRVDNFSEGTRAAWINTLCAMAARRDHLIQRLSSEFDVELCDLDPA